MLTKFAVTLTILLTTVLSAFAQAENPVLTVTPLRNAGGLSETMPESVPLTRGLTRYLAEVDENSKQVTTQGDSPTPVLASGKRVYRLEGELSKLPTVADDENDGAYFLSLRLWRVGKTPFLIGQWAGRTEDRAGLTNGVGKMNVNGLIGEMGQRVLARVLRDAPDGSNGNRMENYTVRLESIAKKLPPAEVESLRPQNKPLNSLKAGEAVRLVVRSSTKARAYVLDITQPGMPKLLGDFIIQGKQDTLLPALTISQPLKGNATLYVLVRSDSVMSSLKASTHLQFAQIKSEEEKPIEVIGTATEDPLPSWETKSVPASALKKLLGKVESEGTSHWSMAKTVVR